MGVDRRNRHEVVKASGNKSGFEISGYSGAYPPPDVIRMFDELTEHGAERILRMAEDEQRHDHKQANRLLSIEAASRILGQLLGFLLGALSITGSIWLISRGNSITGLVSLIGGLGLLAAAFTGADRDKAAGTK